MPTTAFIIRHGDIVYPTNKQGQRLIYDDRPPLSDKGRADIEKLCVHLIARGVNLEALYAGPYRRAKETADIIAEKLVVAKVTELFDLRDVDNPGWKGFPLDKYLAMGGDTYDSADPRSADQESLENLAQRITSVFWHIVRSEQGKTIGIVSHGDPIRLLIHRLSYPEGVLPRMRELVKSDYLDKGEAWRLTFDEQFHLLEREAIGRSKESFGRGERKS